MSRKRSASKSFKARVNGGGLRTSGKGGTELLVRKHADAVNGRYLYVVMTYTPQRGDVTPVVQTYYSSRAAELAVLDVQPVRKKWRTWDGAKEWWL